MNGDILTIKELEAIYGSDTGDVKALRSLDLTVKRGETLALVGESGSGKSTLGLSILRLFDEPNRISKGEIIFHESGNDISVMDLSLIKLREFRWKKIAMIFQSAMNILNPVMRVEDQFVDTFIAHNIEGDYSERINKYLELAGLGPKVRRLYPHELSGGMKQRVIIALALSCEPELLIADEPTTALDVVVQREILYELDRLKKELNLSIIFITHDLSVASAIADRIGIFYAGRIVEIGSRKDIINNPQHPYASMLLGSILTLRMDKDHQLTSIEGFPPDLRQEIQGCSYYPRCPVREAACLTYDLKAVTISPDHVVECIKPGAMNENGTRGTR